MADMAGGLHFDSLADLPPGIRNQVAGKIVAGEFIASKEKTMAGSKYKNQPTSVGGIRFDSKKEAQRYQYLMDAVSAGIIKDLRLQQDFTLQEAYTTPQGQRIRAIRYRADFTYRVVCANYEHICCIGHIDLDWWRDIIQQHGRGVLVAEDVKSKATKTPEYRMKYKLMAEKGYIIREV